MTDFSLGRSGRESRSMRAARGGRSESPTRHVDKVLLITVALLTVSSMVMIRSSGKDATYITKQGIAAVIGIGVMSVLMSFDYRIIIDNAAIIYLGTVVMLALVLVPGVGAKNKGAQAWFEFGALQMQPAEFAKLGIIVSLAAYGAAQRNLLDGRRFVTKLIITAIPVGLIFLQPDLGSALVFLAIVMAMLWMSGARGVHMGVLVAAGIVTVTVAVRLGVLAEFQTARLLAFIDPSRDARGSAFNLAQSKIAIASGGISGKGLFKGTQTQYGFVPEQHSDFIFTAVGEQLGLIGAGFILVLYALLCFRIWRAAALARDAAGTLVCSGVLAMFMFHIFENVGMTMGIMPITGIPLPFLSYGGSSLIASYAAIGLVSSIEMYRFK
jgi:rod shape determining protein RodA